MISPLSPIAAVLYLLAAAATAAPADPEPGRIPESGAAGSPSATALLATRPVLNQKLTLDQAVAVALRESPVIRGSMEEVEAAAGRLEAARAERRPWASLHTFAAGGSAPNIMTGSSPVQPAASMALPGGSFVDQNVTLMLPVYTGGRVQAMVRQARALHGATRAELTAMRQEIALMVRLAYREIQARQSFIGVQRAALQQNLERQRIDQVAYEQEKVPRFYVLRNAAEVANAQQMLTNAERDRDASLIQLRTLMGIHLDSRLELTEPLGFETRQSVLAAYLGPASRVALPANTIPAGPPDDAPAPDARPVLQQLLEVAERNRPELAAAGQRMVASQEEVKVARSTYQPQVGIGVMGDLVKMKGEPSSGGGTFAVTASLPLLDGGARKAQLHTARAEARKREADRQKLALQVGQEVATALLNLEAAEKNVRTARTAIVAAEEDYRVSLLRYTAGKGLNVEALDALTTQVRAQSNHIQALFEYNVAHDRLARALGVLIQPALVGKAGD